MPQSPHPPSPRPQRRTGAKKDGCALLFRTSKFELVQERALEYNDLVKLVGWEPTLVGDAAYAYTCLPPL